MSEAAFLEEVEKAMVLYEKAIGHVASRTRNMIAEHGEIEALSRLMISRTFSKDSRCFGIASSSTRHLRRSWCGSSMCSGAMPSQQRSGGWRIRTTFFDRLAHGPHCVTKMVRRKVSCAVGRAGPCVVPHLSA